MHYRTAAKFLKILVASAGSIVVSPAFANDTLYVWAGDAAHKAPDFFAVVDFDKHSPGYGKIVTIAPLPTTLPSAIPLSNGAIGNEPHHVGVSADGKTLAGGGLLSILRGQNGAFFFDISEPRAPVFLKANTLASVTSASITDEFEPKPGGGFFTTFMGGADGAAPGRVVEYDANSDVVGVWPATPPTDGFDPHGIVIDEAHNLLLTSDFICPLHTLNLGGVSGVVQPRGTVRVWDLALRTITKTITVGDPASPPGTINVELIPHDPHQRAFVTGVLDGKLYVVDPHAGTAKAVFDFNPFALPEAPSPWPHLFRINKAGTRLALTLNYQGQDGKVVWLDIRNPEHPKLLNFVELGAKSGPHYLTFSPNEDRIVVSDYFLVEDLIPTGVVGIDGDHKIHVLDVVDDRLVESTAFNLDFNRDIATGPARPHGLAIVSRHHPHDSDRDDDHAGEARSDQGYRK
jgi:selenium-binding protein 1